MRQLTTAESLVVAWLVPLTGTNTTPILRGVISLQLLHTRVHAWYGYIKRERM